MTWTAATAAREMWSALEEDHCAPPNPEYWQKFFATQLRIAFGAGRASEAPAELREAVDATKISLLVLTTFEERMRDLLHPNMLKDLRFAIEANRHTRRGLLALLDPTPEPVPAGDVP